MNNNIIWRIRVLVRISYTTLTDQTGRRGNTPAFPIGGRGPLSILFGRRLSTAAKASDRAT